MEIKQRGNAFGYKILLILYKTIGYSFVVFILNFVVLYYTLFYPSIKKSLQSYYEHQGLDFTYKIYFTHIKMFAISIFDRFVSRIRPSDLSFDRYNLDVLKVLDNGGIILLSHVGSWATAAHCLGYRLPPMNIVMRENTKEKIKQVEDSNEKHNDDIVKIIDLNQGGIAANIQIANALMNKELIAMMVDRIVDSSKVVEVEFFNTKVKINKNPFDIAKRMNKPAVAIFVINKDLQKYDLIFNEIKGDTLQEMAQNYMDTLEDILRKSPTQWYNFYDFFKIV